MSKMKPWDLGDDESVFRDPPKEKIREYKQKEHNKRQKTIAKIVGENLAAYVCLLAVVLLVGFIWTDIKLFTSISKFVGDAFVTVVLYILVDFCASYIGTKSGKVDDEYLKVHKEYIDLREEVRKTGIAMMEVFCDWQVDVEFEFYIRKRCKAIDINYKEYIKKYRSKTLAELKSEFPVDKAAKIFALNQAKRIELTPDILLTDGKVRSERGGVPISGEEYVEKHTTGWQHIALTALFAIITAVPVFELAKEVSLAMVIYTIFKVAFMFYRMYRGYNRGTKGYNTIEPKHLQVKIKYLNLYLEFINKKIYLTLTDEYGKHIEKGDFDGTKDGTDEQADLKGNREDQSRGKLYDGATASV